MLQNIDFNQLLFIYATHSRNEELIHLLEGIYLQETIKYHHAELTNYIYI